MPRKRKPDDKLSDFKYKLTENLSGKIIPRGVFKTKKEAKDALAKSKRFDMLMGRRGEYIISPVSK